METLTAILTKAGQALLSKAINNSNGNGAYQYQNSANSGRTIANLFKGA